MLFCDDQVRVISGAGHGENRIQGFADRTGLAQGFERLVHLSAEL